MDALLTKLEQYESSLENQRGVSVEIFYGIVVRKVEKILSNWPRKTSHTRLVAHEGANGGKFGENSRKIGLL